METTACILCESNCGIEVRVEDRHFTRIRGDKRHPASKGYTCEKALRLDHYQNSRDRLTSPLRRREDGTFQEIDWSTAISEVAAKLAGVRDTHGGESILYYGGGGQGNHLGGGYSTALRAALGSRFRSSALAQEKTGEFWVNHEMFGTGVRGDFEHTEVAMFIGKNPWQSHGIPEARRTLKAIANDPDRSMVVIDPRRTETADLADYFLQVKPGTDAFCLAALGAILVGDTFTRADSTNLGSTEIGGLAWSEFNTAGSVVEGVVLPRSGNFDDLHIVLKLKTGYNVGVHIDRVETMEELGYKEAHYKIPEQEFPVSPDLPGVTLLGTGGTIASRLDYRTGAVIPAFTPGELYGAVPELADICNLTTKKIFGILILG